MLSRSGAAKGWVVGVLNEKTLRTVTLWHSLSRHGSHAAQHAQFTCTLRAVKCLARVVHVQRNAFLDGKAGIGVHIERHEAVAAAGAAVMKERWTS
jgi:hypothetical protein